MNSKVEEARRYISNAKDILKENGKKEDGYYLDIKYIRMAGNTAYNGVLEALDALIIEKLKGRKNVNWYKEKLSKMDKKVLNAFISAYDILHLSMGYDGIPSAKIANTGLEYAEQIIDWVEMKTA